MFADLVVWVVPSFGMQAKLIIVKRLSARDYSMPLVLCREHSYDCDMMKAHAGLI